MDQEPKKRNPRAVTYALSRSSEAKILNYRQRVTEGFTCVKNKSVLDYGCSGGHWSLAFAISGAKVDAFDKNREAIKILQTLAAEYGVEKNLFAVVSREPPKKKKYDLIFLSGVLQFLDTEAFLEQLNSLAKTGTQLYISASLIDYRLERSSYSLSKGDHADALRNLIIAANGVLFPLNLDLFHSIFCTNTSCLLQVFKAAGWELIDQPRISDPVPFARVCVFEGLFRFEPQKILNKACLSPITVRKANLNHPLRQELIQIIKSNGDLSEFTSFNKNELNAHFTQALADVSDFVASEILELIAILKDKPTTVETLQKVKNDLSRFR